MSTAEPREYPKLSSDASAALSNPIWHAAGGLLHVVRFARRDGEVTRTWCGMPLAPEDNAGWSRGAVDPTGKAPDCERCRAARAPAVREVKRAVKAMG